MKSTLSIDIETYSSVDLKACGVYKYVESNDFEILLFAYAFDDERVEVIDFANGEELPDYVKYALGDSDYQKRAYYATFERLCISKYLGYDLQPYQWHCTMALAASAGLPGSLDQVGKILNLDQQKLSTGRALIQYFCKPCNPTRGNNGRERNYPHHDPDKWDLFKRYNAQDVETERAIFQYLQNSFTPTERAVYVLDQKINDYGVAIDMELVDNIIRYYDGYRSDLLDRAQEISGLDNPQSVQQLKGYLSDQGITVGSLNKEAVIKLIEESDNEDIIELLQNRQESTKTSIKKYDTMQRATCNDGRIRGTLQYYGANRTGRWAGRLVQVQNLPRNYLKELSSVRKLIKRNDFESLEMIYDSLPNLFSQLIRTAFVAKRGMTFAINDYSAIEARVIAWLANEKWRLEVFASHGKIYEASASKMFKVPIEQVDKALRSKGKVSELALGYQGAAGALITMGALRMGLTEEELPGLVAQWRKANPAIIQLWKNVETCAKRALGVPGEVASLQKLNADTPCDIRFTYEDGSLSIELPSGRKLFYVNAKLIGEGRYTKIKYEGMDQTTKKWSVQDTYGGKLVENIVQAIARDCLAEAMLRLDSAQYKICFHVHDEVIAEVAKSTASSDLRLMKESMGMPLKWAPGLMLNAEGFLSEFYMKD